MNRPPVWSARAGILFAVLALLGAEAFGLAGVAAEIGKKFPGFLVSRKLVVTRLNQPRWPGIAAGLRAGDAVLTLNGQPVEAWKDLLRRVREAPDGSAFEYTVSRRGEILRLRIPPAPFRASDFLSAFGVLALTGTVFLIFGVAVTWIRADSLGLGMFAFSAAVDFAMGVSPELAWIGGPALSPIWCPLLVAAILHFAMVFPEPSSRVVRRPSAAALPYLALVPLGLLNLGVPSRRADLVIAVEWVNRWLVFASSLVLLASVLRVHRRSQSRDSGRGEGARASRVPPARERAHVVLVGLALAVLCYAIGFLGSEFGLVPYAPASMFVLPAWIWLATMVVASLRDDVLELGVAARGALERAAASAATVAFTVALFAFTLLAARRAGVRPDPWTVALGCLLVAVLLYDRLRRTAGAVVGRAVNSSISSRPRVLRDLAAELASALDRPAIEAIVLGMAGRLGLSSVRLLVSGADGWREVGGPAHFAPDDPALNALATASAASSPEAAGSFEPRPRAEACAEALRSLGVDLAFPLRFRERCLGFIGFAPAAGRFISREDFSVLSTLASQVAVALENAQAFHRIQELEAELRAENVTLREELRATPPGLEALVGQSAAMKRVYELIGQVAPTDATALLRGETGTGKELVARAIHARSLRRDRPMIRVNCAAVPAALLESEFFGYERGSFTGATARKIGRFELADGGTIFLDEIADLPAELQPKLMRVLQEKEFERIGGSAPIRLNVRVIAATNRDLEGLARQGAFRQDLFFRLNVFPIVVPPLRERREDIPALVAHFIQRYGAKMNKHVSTIEERTLRALAAYRWPGNVRELENLIERAMVLCAGPHLVISEIAVPEATVSPLSSLRPLSEILRDVKVRTIRRALSESAGNQARAASLLGLKPSSLSRMMRNLGLRG